MLFARFSIWSCCFLLACAPLSSAEELTTPEPPAEQIAVSTRVDDETLYLTFEKPNLPTAVFVQNQALWIALPEGATLTPPLQQSSAPPKMPFHIKHMPAKGGNLYRLTLPPNTYPAFLKAKGSTLVIGPTNQTRLPPHTFLSPDFFTRETSKQWRWKTPFTHVVTCRNPQSGQIMHMLLSTDTRKGLGTPLRTRAIQASPTLQGLVITTHDENVQVTPTHLKSAHDLPSPRRPSTKALPWGFVWKDSAETGAPLPPLIKKARAALLRGDTTTAAHALYTFENLQTDAAEDPLYLELKAAVLAFSGEGPEALRLFARDPHFSQHSRPLQAIAWMTSGQPLRGLKTLSRTLPVLRRYPAALRRRLLMTAAETALYTGESSKATLFLGMLRGMNLPPSDKAMQEVLEAYARNPQTLELQGSIASMLNKPPTWHLHHARLRQKHRRILTQLKVGNLTYAKAILKLKMLAQEGRGGASELIFLESLGHTAEEGGDPLSALAAYEKCWHYAPTDYEHRPRVRAQGIKLFYRLLFSKKLSALQRCALFKTYYKAFLPPSPRRESLIETFAQLFARLGLMDHLLPILAQTLPHNTPQKTQLILLCVRHYVKSDQAAKALTCLETLKPNFTLQSLWKKHQAYALAASGESEKALVLLDEKPQTLAEAHVMLPAYRAMNRGREMAAILHLILRQEKDENARTEAFDQLASLLYDQGNLTQLPALLRRFPVTPSPYVKMLLAGVKLDSAAQPLSLSEKASTLKTLCTEAGSLLDRVEATTTRA